MRLVTIAILGLTVGCGSTLGPPDGGAGTGGAGTGGGGTTGTGGTGGGGTTGTGGAGGAACVRNGVTYPPGATVPSGDCNSCFCSENGSIGCTLIACPADAGACAFDATYRYGNTGGLVAYEDAATLAPPAAYRYERTSHITTTPSSSCSPALPACGVEDLWNPFDIMRGIADPDVQAALAKATPPTFGVDARGVDGTIFQFLRADGRGFLAGHACPGGSQGAGCVDAPAGVTRLVSMLRELDQQQLRDPSCAALR